MALFIHSTDDGHVAPFEYKAAAVGAYTLGQLLVEDGGALKAATGTADEGAHYVCMANVTIKEGDLLPCISAQPGIIFEAPLATSGALTVCESYTVVDGKVTSTTGGCFRVTETDGAVAGNAIRGVIA